MPQLVLPPQLPTSISLISDIPEESTISVIPYKDGLYLETTYSFIISILYDLDGNFNEVKVVGVLKDHKMIGLGIRDLTENEKIIARDMGLIV